MVNFLSFCLLENVFILILSNFQKINAELKLIVILPKYFEDITHLAAIVAAEK